MRQNLPKWKSHLEVRRLADSDVKNWMFGAKGDETTMKKVAWAIWIVMLALVVSGELLPGTSPPMRWVSSTGISDKVLHYGAYTLLAVIPMLGFAQTGGSLWALAMILLGVALEFAQRVVPGRSFELGDITANTLGVLTGVAAGWAGRKIRSIAAVREPKERHGP
jgi:VanZ family protein